MSLAELQRAVAELEPTELAAFTEWLAEFEARAWDARLEADLKAGRLDDLLEEAEREHGAGLARPL